MSPDRERALDAATDCMASAMGEEKAIAVVERALIEESPTDLGRKSLERVLDRLKTKAIAERKELRQS